MKTNRFNRRLLISILFFFIISIPAIGQELVVYKGYVVEVIDGDTLGININGQPWRVRLAGIDAPEIGQWLGNDSKYYVQRLILGRWVNVLPEVDPYGRLVVDQYGRPIVYVLLQKDVVLNYEIVREGWAWWYWEYSTDANIALLEKEAQENRRGIWGYSNQIPPWEWRQGRR